jgi:hypothetical protein
MLSTALLAGEDNRLACQGSGPDGCAPPIYENMSGARVWHSFQETDGKNCWPMDRCSMDLRVIKFLGAFANTSCKISFLHVCLSVNWSVLNSRLAYFMTFDIAFALRGDTGAFWILTSLGWKSPLGWFPESRATTWGIIRDNVITRPVRRQNIRPRKRR